MRTAQLSNWMSWGGRIEYHAIVKTVGGYRSGGKLDRRSSLKLNKAVIPGGEWDSFC